MPYKKEEDDDLFEDDFEFVDDEEDDEDDEDSELDEIEDEEEAPAEKPKRGGRKTATRAESADGPKGRTKPAPKRRGKVVEEESTSSPDEEPLAEEDEESAVAAAPEGPPADHVIHVYELRKFKRTIPRAFTSEDADKFAEEYNRTSSNHSRWAVSGSKDDQPTPKI